MKKLSLLLLLLFISSIVSAQINISPPGDIVECSNNGIATADLTPVSSDVLDNLNPDLYTVNYYISLQDAQNNINPIAQPESFTTTIAFEQTIYVRVTENANPDNYAVTNFNVVVPGVYITNPLQDGVLCPGFSNGPNVGYILDTGLSSELYSFYWFYNGVIIPGANESSFMATQAGEYTVTITSFLTACVNSDTAIVTGSDEGPASVIATVTGNTITVNVNGTGNYTYTLNNFTSQESNVFENVSEGSYNIYVTDECGNINITTVVVNPEIPAPTGQAVQTFEPGATLADIELEGQNILWYDNPGGTAGEITPLNNDEPLPPSTVLVNGTTYYASQTINGIESQQRFAVTVNVALNTNEYTLESVQYYPNPATDYITFTNNIVINSIEVYNQLGQKVISNNYNSNSVKTDISALANGVYLVKIQSGNTEKVVKVIKQ